MVSVVTEAKPAKLISTLRTCHVHAALILLNSHLALGALLRIKLHPNFTVILTLSNSVKPLGQHVTLDRSMCSLQALKAPVMATGAYDIGLFHGWIVDSQGAAWSWTPFGALIEVNIGFLPVVLVFLELLLVAHLLEERLRNYQFAWRDRTCCVNRVGPSLQLIH